MNTMAGIIQPGITTYGGLFDTSRGWRDKTKIFKEGNSVPRKSPFIFILNSFCGRKKLFKKWLKNFKRLDFPKNQIQIFWVSASQDNSFNLLLSQHFSLLKGYYSKIFVITRDIPIFKEGGENPLGWIKRNDGVTKYLNFSRRYIEPSDYVLLWEDDVLIPPDSLNKVLPFMKNKNIGAMVMRCPYRPDGRNRGKPLAWNTIPIYQVLDGVVVKSFKTDFMNLQEDGVEEAGGGTTGCQLIRTELILRIPFVNIYKDISGPDVSYGERLREAGYKTLIHWGIHCGHMNLNKGKIETYY